MAKYRLVALILALIAVSSLFIFLLRDKPSPQSEFEFTVIDLSKNLECSIRRVDQSRLLIIKLPEDRDVEFAIIAPDKSWRFPPELVPLHSHDWSYRQKPALLAKAQAGSEIIMDLDRMKGTITGDDIPLHERQIFDQPGLYKIWFSENLFIDYGDIIQHAWCEFAAWRPGDKEIEPKLPRNISP